MSTSKGLFEMAVVETEEETNARTLNTVMRQMDEIKHLLADHMEALRKDNKARMDNFMDEVFRELREQRSGQQRMEAQLNEVCAKMEECLRSAKNQEFLVKCAAAHSLNNGLRLHGATSVPDPIKEFRHWFQNPVIPYAAFSNPQFGTFGGQIPQFGFAGFPINNVQSQNFMAPQPSMMPSVLRSRAGTPFGDDYNVQQPSSSLNGNFHPTTGGYRPTSPITSPGPSRGYQSTNGNRYTPYWRQQGSNNNSSSFSNNRSRAGTPNPSGSRAATPFEQNPSFTNYRSQAATPNYSRSRATTPFGQQNNASYATNTATTPHPYSRSTPARSPSPYAPTSPIEMDGGTQSCN